jgi:hypothetical protein
MQDKVGIVGMTSNDSAFAEAMLRKTELPEPSVIGRKPAVIKETRTSELNEQGELEETIERTEAIPYKIVEEARPAQVIMPNGMSYPLIGNRKSRREKLRFVSKCLKAGKTVSDGKRLTAMELIDKAYRDGNFIASFPRCDISDDEFKILAEREDIKLTTDFTQTLTVEFTNRIKTAHILKTTLDKIYNIRTNDYTFSVDMSDMTNVAAQFLTYLADFVTLRAEYSVQRMPWDTDIVYIHLVSHPKDSQIRNGKNLRKLHKTYIVNKVACLDNPADVQDYLKRQFGLEPKVLDFRR